MRSFWKRKKAKHLSDVRNGFPEEVIVEDTENKKRQKKKIQKEDKYDQGRFMGY